MSWTRLQLLDDLVGTGEQRCGDLLAQYFGGR